MKTLSYSVELQKKRVTMLLVSAIPLALVAFSGPVAAGQRSAVAQSPQAACPADGQCFADVLAGSPFYDYANNLYKANIISGYPCGGTNEPCDSENRPYYRAGNGVTRAQMTKFVDLARTQPGIHIDTATHAQPIYSRSTATGGVGVTGVGTGGAGVYGESTYGPGIRGYSSGGAGVYAEGSGSGSAGSGVYGKNVNNNGIGVYGLSSTSVGVQGFTQGTSFEANGIAGLAYGTSGGVGVYGEVANSSGYAGYFEGKVHVNGTLSKSAGTFKIDHPLDPENKYLYHSFVESPDMMNVYNGNTVLDAQGEARVKLPSYFEALNMEFRYQLTAIGAPGPNLYLAEKVKDNSFKIAGGQAGMEVSWQVTGIRHDPYAVQHRVQVEENKSQEEQGLYLHPDAYGQPESKQIGKVEEPGAQP